MVWVGLKFSENYKLWDFFLTEGSSISIEPLPVLVWTSGDSAIFRKFLLELLRLKLEDPEAALCPTQLLAYGSISVRPFL